MRWFRTACTPPEPPLISSEWVHDDDDDDDHHHRDDGSGDEDDNDDDDEIYSPSPSGPRGGKGTLRGRMQEGAQTNRRPVSQTSMEAGRRLIRALGLLDTSGDLKHFTAGEAHAGSQAR